MTNAKEFLHNWYIKSEQIAPVRIAKFDRKGLIGKFAEFGFTKGAEIGIDRGTFSEYMFKNIPNLELLGVDPFERESGREQEAKKKLKDYNCTIDVCKSMDTVKKVKDNSLDFVYIDGDHTFDYIMTDLIEWSKKVKIGGIVSGHDYYRFRKAGIIQAVDLYTHMHKIDEWFITDEKTSSFFWIKNESIY